MVDWMWFALTVAEGEAAVWSETELIADGENRIMECDRNRGRRAFPIHRRDKGDPLPPREYPSR